MRIIFILAICILLGCFFLWGKRRPSDSSINPLELSPGPIRHTVLPDTLIKRIEALESIFLEVYPQSHEEWVDGFKRDHNPEKEVVIWECIGSAYSQFTTSQNFSLEARKEALGILLVRSGGSDEDIKEIDLKHLTLEDAKKLTSLYRCTGEPILYSSSK